MMFGCRGSALGALMGAAHGEKGIPAWMLEGLTAEKEIRAEIDAFVDAISAGARDKLPQAHVEL